MYHALRGIFLWARPPLVARPMYSPWVSGVIPPRLSEEMSDIHSVFHVSQLNKCLRVPEEHVPLEVMVLQPDLQYHERPIKILDVATRQTRRPTVRFYRGQWSNHTYAEATWEREDDLRKEFPHLFED